MKGKFIVFEGIDGSGTSTQSTKLHRSLLEMGVAVHVTEEPSDGPVGGIIKQILHGRLISFGQSGSSAPSWREMALLFASDRVDHLECEVLPNLNDGINVISDRYVYSSLVYQTVISGNDENEKWIREINRFAVKPDIVFFLDVSPEEAQRRRLARRIGHELYEDLPLQRKIAEKYRHIMKQLSGSSDEGNETVILLDGERNIEEIHTDCLEHVKKLLDI